MSTNRPRLLRLVNTAFMPRLGLFAPSKPLWFRYNQIRTERKGDDPLRKAHHTLHCGNCHRKFTMKEVMQLFISKHMPGEATWVTLETLTEFGTGHKQQKGILNRNYLGPHAARIAQVANGGMICCPYCLRVEWRPGRA